VIQRILGRDSPAARAMAPAPRAAEKLRRVRCAATLRLSQSYVGREDPSIGANLTDAIRFQAPFSLPRFTD